MIHKSTEYGTVVINSASGVGLYTPDPGYEGKDTLEISASEGIADSDTTEVTFQVGPVEITPQGTTDVDYDDDDDDDDDDDKKKKKKDKKDKKDKKEG